MSEMRGDDRKYSLTWNQSHRILTRDKLGGAPLVCGQAVVLQRELELFLGQERERRHAHHGRIGIRPAVLHLRHVL